jgi:hypothetical protein
MTDENFVLVFLRLDSLIPERPHQVNPIGGKPKMLLRPEGDPNKQKNHC